VLVSLKDISSFVNTGQVYMQIKSTCILWCIHIQSTHTSNQSAAKYTTNYCTLLLHFLTSDIAKFLSVECKICRTHGFC